MSHFSHIKTKLKCKESLVKSLNTLGHDVEHNVQLEVRGGHAVGHPKVDACLAIASDIGFKWCDRSDHYYMDLEELIEDYEEEAVMDMPDTSNIQERKIKNLISREILAVTNAQNFLQMDMANLSNDQQAFVLQNQQKQQQLLSNQSAINAAKQFNATSENQTDQFMTSLAVEIDKYNNQTIN